MQDIEPGAMIDGVPSVSKQSIECPGGVLGTKEATTTPHYVKIKKFTVETYWNTCTNQPCEDIVTDDGWNWAPWGYTTTVKIECNQPVD